MLWNQLYLNKIIFSYKSADEELTTLAYPIPQEVEKEAQRELS